MYNYASVAPTFLVGELIEVEDIAQLADVGNQQLMKTLSRTTG